VDIAFMACLSGFVLGWVSLFGIPRHGAKVILWKVLIGIPVSCICGLVNMLNGLSRIVPQ